MLMKLIMAVTLMLSATPVSAPHPAGIDKPELHMPEDGVFGVFTEHYDSIVPRMKAMGYVYASHIKGYTDESLTLVRFENPAVEYSTILIFAKDGAYVGFMIRREVISRDSYHALKNIVFVVNVFIESTYDDFKRDSPEQFGMKRLREPTMYGNVVVTRCQMAENDQFMLYVKALAEEAIPEYDEGLDEYNNPKGSDVEPEGGEDDEGHENTGGVGRGW